MISKKAIIQFQNIYYKEFGKRISFPEATKQAINLLKLYKAVINNPSSEGLRNHEKARNK